MKRNRLSSSARIFEKRGDPWLSEREGIKDFQRVPDIEDADYDADKHRLDAAFYEGLTDRKNKGELIRKVGRDKSPPKEPDFMRRIAAVRRAVKNERAAKRVNQPNPTAKVRAEKSTGIKRNYRREPLKPGERIS